MRALFGYRSKGLSTCFSLASLENKRFCSSKDNNQDNNNNSTLKKEKHLNQRKETEQTLGNVEGHKNSDVGTDQKKKSGMNFMKATTPSIEKGGRSFETTTEGISIKAAPAQVKSVFNEKNAPSGDKQAGGLSPTSNAHHRKPIILKPKHTNLEAGVSKDKTGKIIPKEEEENAIKTAAKPEHGPMTLDYGPLRPSGLWVVDDVLDEEKKRVDFRRIDDVESELMTEMKETDEALVPYDEEEKWKHKLMFVHKFKKTPKHLTWKELGEEIECLDCVIELDKHRPEEIFTINFFFTDKKTGTRDIVWSASNDVSYSEGFTDLLAAVGACLGRSDVHRTIRFDDGKGTTADLAIRKRSRYTSDINLAFRPPEKYNLFDRKADQDEFAASMEAEGMSTWGYHPSLMDPEYSELDFEDPEGTYEMAISAHGFCFIFLKAINRLLAKPMKEFYRPSQLVRMAKVKTEDEIGFSHAIKGWMGVDEQIYPHFTPIEALQDHWLGQDAPFSLVAIVNKLREMNYLKPENPEFQSWLAVRNHDTHIAIRNMGVKLLGVGASSLFLPVTHDSTVNKLLPKHQQRRIESKVSLNAVLGLPDETRRIEEFKKITGSMHISSSSTTGNETSTSNVDQDKDAPVETPLDTSKPLNSEKK